jgi:hypothetical protein
MASPRPRGYSGDQVQSAARPVFMVNRRRRPPGNPCSKGNAMYRVAFAGLALLFVSTGVARAAEDPNGSWKWTSMFNNQTRENTLKLKLEGDKLTGSVSGRNNTETAIENATYKDGDIAFSVTTERNGQKFTSKYSGKLSGDTIKGKIESQRDGQARSRDWEAKRAK